MKATNPKLKTCRVCKAKFTPKDSFETWCGPDHGYEIAMARLEKAHKAEKLKERKADAVKREAQKTPSALEAECRAIVQEIARIRDRNDGCISCHMPANYGGQWHGSHFRPAGNNAAVQFHLWNIHKACAQCNLFKGGNLGAYRPRLIEKIGADRVEWLDGQNQVVKTNPAYLIRFKKVMGKRLRRIRKAAQA
jgi:hypothetical protein